MKIYLEKRVMRELVAMTLTRISMLNDGDKNEQTCKTIVDAVANVMKNLSTLVCLEQRTVAHNVLRDIGIMLHQDINNKHGLLDSSSEFYDVSYTIMDVSMILMERAPKDSKKEGFEYRVAWLTLFHKLSFKSASTIKVE